MKNQNSNCGFNCFIVVGTTGYESIRFFARIDAYLLYNCQRHNFFLKQTGTAYSVGTTSINSALNFNYRINFLWEHFSVSIVAISEVGLHLSSEVRE